MKDVVRLMFSNGEFEELEITCSYGKSGVLEIKVMSGHGAGNACIIAPINAHFLFSACNS